MESDSTSYEVKIFTINIETPDGKLPPAKVQVPNIPMRIVDLIPPMQQLCNGIVALAIRREEGLGFKVSCHAGCGVCCSQLVPLSAPEAFFINDYINSLPFEQQTEIRKRFASIRNTMESVGLIERLLNLDNTNEHESIAWDYFQLGMPCPFLEDNSCSIHQYRPFACREYNIVSPAELCADPFHNKVKRIQIPRNMTTAMSMFSAELFNLPPMLIPMSLALEWVKENQFVGERTWQGIWLFERMMEYATGNVIPSSSDLSSLARVFERLIDNETETD